MHKRTGKGYAEEGMAGDRRGAAATCPRGNIGTLYALRCYKKRNVPKPEAMQCTKLTTLILRHRMRTA